MSPGRELHPVLSPARRRELVREGGELFHAGRFFAAHEAWEEVWRSTTPEPRDLFQGLVQLAAAFHHLHARRRPEVARRVLAKARRRLASLVEVRSPASEAMEALLAELAGWDRWLAAPSGEPPPLPRLDGLLDSPLDAEAPPVDQPGGSGRRAT